MSLVGLTMLTLGPVVSLPPPPTTAAEQLYCADRAPERNAVKILNALVQLIAATMLALALLATAFSLLRFFDTLCVAAHAFTFGPSFTHALAVIIGGLAMWLWQFARGRERRRALPPATARQIERAARASRLEARDPPPRWIPTPADHFTDNEDTK